MRKLIYAALCAEPTLVAIIPVERWLSAGAVDDKPARPFAVIRISDAPVTDVKSGQPRLQVWVHDDRGSYARIDDVLDLVKSTLSVALPMEDSTDRIVSAEWTGDSPDFTDEGYNTNTRYSSYTLTGRK